MVTTPFFLDHDDQFAFTPQVIREHVRQILASPEFASSERMSRFLQYVVDRSLDGRARDLKEYSIGVEVFDRKPDYDPRVDPIVRVEARRLRSKLAAYYRNHPKDGLVVDLPKGSYAPKFCRATSPTDASVPTSLKESPRVNAPSAERTVAVLPFTNVNRDPGQDYFSDGLTEELIHALTKVCGLRVVAWSTARQLRGEERDIYSIGERLCVETVLTGSVRTDRDRIRILAQLVDTKTGYYLWSETYDRHLEEMFAIQVQIASSIASALELKFGTQQQRGRNVQAYNEYLLGRFHWNKRSIEGLKRAIEHFQKSLEIDPNFALGYVGLADAYVLLADYGVEYPTRCMPNARAAALKALSIDPTLGEAECTLGFLKSVYDWEWEAAGEHFRRSMRLNPGYATTFHWYALDYCALRGRIKEAQAAIKQALDLDPLSSIIREGFGYIHLLGREYEQALVEHKKLLDFDPYFYKVYGSLGRVYSQMGRYDEAIEALEFARKHCGEVPSLLGCLGQSLGLAGHIDGAREILGQLSEIARDRHVQASCFALVNLGMGNKDCALQWLERGYGQRDISLATIAQHPAYEALHGEPRFNALLEKIGLPEMISR